MFEVYEVHILQSCIFALSIGIHKKKMRLDVGVVSTGTTTHVELSNVVSTLTSFVEFEGRSEYMHCISSYCIIAYEV
jgi:hypothetical protein